MRSRTLSPLSAALKISLAFSGAWPSSAHWPLEVPARGGRTGRAAGESVVLMEASGDGGTWDREVIVTPEALRTAGPGSTCPEHGIGPIGPRSGASQAARQHMRSLATRSRST